MALTAPYRISLLHPENHVANTGTAGCCIRNCSHTDTKHKPKAAHLREIKVNVMAAGALANGRQQRSEAACQLQLILLLGISVCLRMQMFEKENVTMW